ncbi:protein kinase [Brachybacterium sp. J144]|uniref:serine/threonine-protein kinase n=1 Tax=Brachybacterium sp. J144 TaxID=3116487 RepID=UPI002E78379F|nr:protein kinase [Brachybacterium sp. J144]MEE1649319.1 protein kinase [Brachybacterium sp. J144]
MSDVIAGRIELLDPLARGASGSLWRAVDRRYGAICAAKVMRQRDGAEVLRFVREQSVGTAQDLGRHPHLLPPYTWVAEDDTIVLVMPLVHGGTLASLTAEHGPLSPALVAHLLRQLLDALATLHESGWVHRDVKPANLLLAATGAAAPHLLLADFGIALHTSDIRLTETGLVQGTPGFQAPEAIAGQTTSTAQDVWAAAACALEALAPSAPRERPTAGQLPARLDAALAGSPDPAARPLGALLHAMLSADPADRPSAAEARETIPLFTAPPEHWALTRSGARVTVPDRVEGTVGRPEVPLEGPASLAGLAPGLHERLTARSTASSGPDSPTELFVRKPTPRDPIASPPAPGAVAPSAGSPAPAIGSPSSGAGSPAPSAGFPAPGTGWSAPAVGPSILPVGPPASAATPRGSRRGLGLGLLLLAAVLLAGSGGLLWAAL